MIGRRHRSFWRGRQGGDGGEGEAGFTVVELAVVMVVAAIVMAMFVPFVASVSRAAQTTVAYQQATATGRVALQDLAVQLSSASEVCLLDTTGAAPTAATLGTTCPTPTSDDGLEILTTSYGTSHWVQWWYEAPSAGGNGLLESQSWVEGQSPSTASVTVVAGTTATTGLSSCSISPGSGGLFTLLPATSSSRTAATISLSITCTASHQAATVSMQSTVSALNTSVTGG